MIEEFQYLNPHAVQEFIEYNITKLKSPADDGTYNLYKQLSVYYAAILKGL